MTATVTTTAITLDALAALLPGRVVLPRDEAYDHARLGFVVNVDQRPAAIVEAHSVEDVVACVGFAAQHGYTVSAQPLGHGATTAVDGTILLRTRALQHIEVDAAARTARVGAGVTWGELLAATAPHGLTGLAGSSAEPTVVGFTISGGLSWFARKHGVAAHHLVSVDLVDATGTLRTVDAQSDPDLFWALCGGGGDFGIVTSMVIGLVDAPQLFGGRIMWPIEMAQPVLREFRRVTSTAPEELTVWSHVMRYPPLPFIPEFLRGRSFVTIDATHLGGEEQARALLASFYEIPGIAFDTMGPLPIDALASVCSEPTDPAPVLTHTALLNDLDGAAVDALLSVVGHQAHIPLPAIQLRHLGGALARGTAADGPHGAVTEQYQLFALGVVAVPELVPAIEGTFVQLAAALAPYESGRQFLTFVAESDPSRSFSAEALGRLREVKRAVDPNGVVRSNRPV